MIVIKRANLKYIHNLWEENSETFLMHLAIDFPNPRGEHSARVDVASQGCSFYKIDQLWVE